MNKANKTIISSLAIAGTIVTTAAAGLKIKERIDYDKKIETKEKVMDLINSYNDAKDLLVGNDVKVNIPLIISKLTTPAFLSREMPEIVADYFDDEKNKKYKKAVKDKLLSLVSDIEKYVKKDDSGIKEAMIQIVNDYVSIIELLELIYTSTKYLDSYEENDEDSPKPNSYQNTKVVLNKALSMLGFYSDNLEMQIKTIS